MCSSGFDGRPLRQRLDVVPGYPGSGVWHKLTDVDVDGFKDIVVENEIYQVVLPGSFPGIYAYKSKLNPECPYFETIEPESGSVGKLRGAVIGEEMYYSSTDNDEEWDGTMDYSDSIESNPWWDGIFKLYTPMRKIEDTRQISFRIEEFDGVLHVVQTANYSRKYEPIVKIEYHYIFSSNDKAIYWYNLRQFGRTDAHLGESTRIGRIYLAGKVPVGWALPCNKWDCYDSYYWNEEFSGLCPGNPWKVWMDHSERELPWMEENGAPPDHLMFYYDSRGIYGGSGAILLPGWVANVPHVKSSMSRQYRGWWRIDDLTKEDRIFPEQETHGGLCACILTGPDDPLGEARQLVSQLVDTKVMKAASEVQASTVLKKIRDGLMVYMLNPHPEHFTGSFKLKDMGNCGLDEGIEYIVEQYSPEIRKWKQMRCIKGQGIMSEGIDLSIKPGKMGCFRIRK